MDQFGLKKQEADQEEFDQTFNQVSDNESIEEDTEVTALYSEYVSPLGTLIQKQWDLAQSDRNETEDRWLKDLRQYRGEYDPEVLERLHPKRSRAFLSLTRSKTKTAASRMTDLLFPSNGDKNWGIAPSPIPELNPQIVQNIIVQFQEQTGQPITEEQILRDINSEAKKRAEAMEAEMHDQLSELKYREIIRNTILSGNLYGTGILKGPLARVVQTNRWLPSSDGQWANIKLQRVLPYCEHVPVWDIYPDMSARQPEDMRYIFQRHVMNRNKLWELSKRQDFNGDAITAYMKLYPDGDSEYKNHENDLRALNTETTENDATSLPRSGRYDVLEYWGYMSSSDLKEHGLEIDEEQMGLEVAVNVWMVGPVVIKAVVSPVEGVVFPYFFYYYDKDDSSIWGDGIPTIMRDAQKLFNAAVRAMLDNAAIAAGPIIEANMDLLDVNENPKDLYPFRVFERQGAGMEAQSPAIRVETMPSYTNEFLAMINFFMTAADDVTTLPRYMYGENQSLGGAGRTATGLSMLMGASNVTLKEQVKNFDDGITSPFIKALYNWNMAYNPKEHIKGDYTIRARGATSLIAREVKTENLVQFMNVTANEVDAAYVRRDQILRNWAKYLELDEDELIKDPNTVKMEEEAAAKAAEEDKQFEKKLAMIKATSGGHMSKSGIEGGAMDDLKGLTPGMNPEMEDLSPQELMEGEIPEVTSGSETISQGT